MIKCSSVVKGTLLVLPQLTAMQAEKNSYTQNETREILSDCPWLQPFILFTFWYNRKFLNIFFNKLKYSFIKLKCRLYIN